MQYTRWLIVYFTEKSEKVEAQRDLVTCVDLVLGPYGDSVVTGLASGH